jgi:hypothetical protein
VWDWEQVAAMHGDFFGDIRSANRIMQVVRFIDPDWLVEIEADAVLESASAGAIIVVFNVLVGSRNADIDRGFLRPLCFSLWL